MLRIFKRVWNYFFESKSVDPPLGEVPLSTKYTRQEVKFFEPVTMKEKFDKSKSLKDFINKIDKPNE